MGVCGVRLAADGELGCHIMLNKENVTSLEAVGIHQ